jgi:hypothetical protein
MQTKNWHAWINTMPPGPARLHVVGDVEVGNPGIDPVLTEKVPQGINPAILLLDLHLVQQPGVWPQVVTCKQARFDKVLAPGAARYTEVEVFAGSQSIAKIPVKIVT